MNDWPHAIIELVQRLPFWVRVLLGLVAVCMVADGVYHLARQAMIDSTNAIIVGLILAAWVAGYIVMRGRARKPPPG
jgi:hypothetical protein